MRCFNWPISICSWSLQTEIDQVAKSIEPLGIMHTHLTLGPYLIDGQKDYIDKVLATGCIISATMINQPQEDYSTLESIRRTGGIVPDEHWPINKQLCLDAIDLTASLDVKYLSLHAGFIDETSTILHDRIKTLADYALEKEVQILLETGQETATELKEFIENMSHSAIGVNFDPANMILYDKGNPIEALEILAPWIKHIHIKDAIMTKTPGTWGTEVPWGEGEVNCELFLETLNKIGFNGAIAIEREAGNNRLKDIKNAVTYLRKYSR